MSVTIEIIERISSLDQGRWNALSGHDVFNSYEFISALENSGSVGENTGWQGAHLLARSGDQYLGAMPLWVKTHSQGEYVFDHAFADAYARSGVDYYPKLLAATPFTPVNGGRIFAQDPSLRDALLETAYSIALQNDFSSVHINFATDDAPDKDWLERHSVQYHFFNQGYKSFDDFLATLTSSKRKNIRKERAQVASSGLNIKAKTGNELTPEDWDCFWQCYQDTGSRKWGTPYLTRGFFDEIALSMKNNILMFLAYDGEVPVASALNFKDGQRLIGRYWGCLMDTKFLHLELCYYQAIDYAIAHHIPLIEAGAQGEHKLGRGYAPVITKSYHRFTHPEFHKAIARFITQERKGLAEYSKDAAAHLPYRKDQSMIKS